MENKGMKLEETKIEEFFDRLWKNSMAKVGSWILTGIFLFFIMILCLFPAQEMFAEGWFMPIPAFLLVMFTYLMLSSRIRLYNQYNENQKSCFMTDILKYHPISRKEVWKHKTKKWVIFLAKVTGVGLGLQIVVALIAYQTISWLNFFYIIFCMIAGPATGVLLFDSIAKQVGE